MNGIRQQPQQSLKHTHTHTQMTLFAKAAVLLDARACMYLSTSHPDSMIMKHRPQAAPPGLKVTFVVTVWLQCGQQVRAGKSVRYGSATGTAWGWVTMTC